MAPEDLLQRLSELMDAGAAKGRGGVILLRFDHAETLRDQLGFTGLNSLVERVSEHVVENLPESSETVRFCWDSLMLCLPEMEGQAFDQTAGKLFSALTDRNYAVGDDEVALTVSLAHARFDHRFTNVDELLIPLVRRVEHIERDGGNALAAVRPGISASKAKSSSDHMLGLLMEALRTDSIKVVFQPLLATSGSETSESFQMLPRLASGDGKLITAAEFLPIAREAALLPVLDRWMTVHATRLLRGPLAERDARLFINQSEALLSESERREWLSRHLASEPQLAGRLVLEIPLEDAMTHLRGAARLFEIAREHEIGVCLSHVDEHSRWSLLTGELAVDFVRMSPDFVARLTRDPSLEGRFLELSEPVRSQGVRIIMPMIEDPQTAASMWRSGADLMQGNMIQAPEDSIAV